MNRLNAKYNELISEFRGIYSAEYASPNAKQEKQFTECIDKILLKINKKHSNSYEVSNSDIVGNWEKIVGKKLCKYCQPQEIIHQNILIIAARNSIVKQELLLKKQEILKTLQTLFRYSKIKDIKIC